MAHMASKVPRLCIQRYGPQIVNAVNPLTLNPKGPKPLNPKPVFSEIKIKV